jgi:hypothetical protein
MGFITVPTISFGTRYCFFIIDHDRRRFPFLDITKHPASVRAVQQLRLAFLFNSDFRFLIFDT